MSSGPISPEQATELLFWPALVFILVATVISFGVGGYVAGRLAGRRRLPGPRGPGRPTGPGAGTGTSLVFVSVVSSLTCFRIVLSSF